ncbi:hypothetical protein [Gallaecimonas mangrovi]|uniref:hypothetical protein n=1 Tax=Gallaecimonas mangrovi TaxID=2291597 RepID=UPI001866B343|nr:hypothetical protein [Gallaecimonas mangrovi]
MSKLFLIPLVLCVIWYIVMRQFAIPFEKGRKGFYWIIGLSAFIIAFMTLMLKLTATQ